MSSDAPSSTIAANTNTSAEPAHPTPLTGAIILGILVVAAVAYVAVNLEIGRTDFWAGFLFLTYWMAAEQAKPGAFLSCAVGAVVGTGLALALQILPPLYGVDGMAAAYVLILGAIYLQIIGKAHIAINFSTMIFLTMCAAVPMQAHVKILTVFPALIAGIIFWGGLILGGQKIAATVQARKAAAAT